ncbi:host-nuclease inhibitor Gam family protein [Sphingomonas sp. Leaf37]|uniref:host-nuclease inhibitor Gam family protein n=1 Tax=Sphingomonas sp. Leaf37 TaxID=2876552 RepID=UPI001E2CBE0D|nr:host-nuclease inhibitor Gam family protein [Sphingomonas sp. Leaf37]
MTKLRINAPVDQATPLIERYAALGTELALADVARNDAITAANTAADRITVPIVDEMTAIREQLEPWWRRNAATLLPTKRKSMELGGCVIGSKTGSTSVTFALGNDELAASTLQAARWSKAYVRVKPSVDKAAVKTALAGKDGDKLRALGFGVTTPIETFILDRADQSGTVTA